MKDMSRERSASSAADVSSLLVYARSFKDIGHRPVDCVDGKWTVEPLFKEACLHFGEDQNQLDDCVDFFWEHNKANILHEDSTECGVASYVEDDVTIYMDVSIGHGVQVWKNALICGNVRIKGLERVHDLPTVICEDAFLGDNVLIYPEVIVGERTRIEVGSVIGCGIKIGADVVIDRGTEIMYGHILDQNGEKIGDGTTIPPNMHVSMQDGSESDYVICRPR